MSWLVFAQTDVLGTAGPDLVPSVWRVLGALAVVLALLAALAWLLRRQQALRRSGRGMGVESALSLGERRSVAIVSIEGRRLLLGLAPNGVTLLTELAPLPTFDEAVSRATAGDGDARA
ncbi:MAG: flagellar biosynthetic protein FliO [Acidobacteria bacterium SCN 69-37]|nr:MAG: flagellar biosynthetic protein FliO [Acidobacteria bacterium SCN 69-37]